MIQTLTRKYKENLASYSFFLNYSTIKFHKKNLIKRVTFFILNCHGIGANISIINVILDVTYFSTRFPFRRYFPSNQESRRVLDCVAYGRMIVIACTV